MRFFALTAMVMALGCGGSSSGAKGPTRPLPSYVGHSTELFDDDIEPKAVGLDLSQAPQLPRMDPVLRERTQVGDAVLRARIDTVTARSDGTRAHYDLGLHTLGQLAGEHPPTESFTVRIDQAAPSSTLLKNFQDRLGGKVFIVFLREFVRGDGDTELHFHASPDDKDIAEAVKEAAALADFK
jgi:hypothetical protein